MMDSLKDGGIILGVVGVGAMIIKYFSKKSPIKTDTESLVINRRIIDRRRCIFKELFGV